MMVCTSGLSDMLLVVRTELLLTRPHKRCCRALAAAQCYISRSMKAKPI